jgi:hypothetical protein
MQGLTGLSSPPMETGSKVSCWRSPVGERGTCHHCYALKHTSTHSHKKTIHRSFNPFFTHTVIISPEVSSRRVWRSEKRLAATQHCQEFEHMVNQPHILLGTFNDSIMIDHRQFELVIRILIPFPFSLHTKTHIFFINLCIHHTSLWHRNTTWMAMLFQMGIPYSVSNGEYTNPAHTQTRYNQTTKQPDTLSSPIVFSFFFPPLLFLRFSVPFFLSFSCFIRFLFLLFLFNVVLLASGAVRVRTRTVFLLG